MPTSAKTQPLTRRASLFALLGVAVSGVAVASAAAREPKEAEIHIDNFTFNPAELVVARGATVKWINSDDIPHTVVEKENRFRSKPMDTDDTFTQKFDTPGVVEYFCSLHPHMTGRIVVK